MTKVKDTLETLTIPLFLALCGFLLYMHLNTEVDVHICSVDNLTTYVNREKPHALLNLGECRAERMTNGEYSELLRTFKGSR